MHVNVTRKHHFAIARTSFDAYMFQHNGHSIADTIQAIMRTDKAPALAGWGSKANKNDIAQPNHVGVRMRDCQNFTRPTAQSTGTTLRMQRAAARTYKGYDEWRYFERFVWD